MNYYKDNFKRISQEYLTVFNHQWNNLLNGFVFRQHQFSTGNRLRPLIVLVGYLATKKGDKLSEDEYQYISRLALSLEIIHKSSLILDDLIDDDPERHGEAAFHIEYGMENTVMFAIHMLCVSIDNLNTLLSELPESHILKTKGLNLLLETMYNMSLGELKELNLTKENLHDYECIKQIINLQTAPLITNSLIFGYYAANGNNENVKKTMNRIGNGCGYIFQIMNDMEPFCQQNKLKKHKGRVNIDISHAKKNIVFALMYNLLSLKEKEKICLADNIEEINYHLIKFFDEYKIKDSFMEEIQFVYLDIKNQIPSLGEYGVSQEWCKLFEHFIDSLMEECKNRLI